MTGFSKLSAQIFILGVGIFACLGQKADAAGGAAEPIAVKVLVKDYAGVSPDVIEKARIVTTRIYRRIGVDITWFGDGTQEQEIPGDPAGNEAFCASVLVVNLHLEPPEADGDRLGTMGIAAVGSRVARVFMVPVTQAAFKAHLEPSTVLGHVIAHELGHLLLPPHSHSPKGLMRATLDDMGVRMAQLWFDETQAALIRIRLSGSAPPDLVARGREPDRQ